MLELLQFLFATAKDQNLYCNPDGLVKELVHDYQFTHHEVEEALAWFAPILQGSQELDISPEAIRSLSQWEEKYLPPAIIKQIRCWERNKTINLSEREILLDRLGELSLDWQMDAEEMQEILNGLIYHLQHYKPKAAHNPLSLFYWADNGSVH